VLLVVVFHLWPDRLTGGFVGVDVFFAISGYLITGHLLREKSKSGRIDLPAFWARRIRRLLPAASLVLAVSLIATVLVLPERVWQFTAQQVGASALAVENWVLAANSVDYFAATNQPTLVQHYWSLSLEEQFYLFWPLFLVAVFAVARKRTPGVRARLLGGAVALVFLASLAWSIVNTAEAPALAYFSTFTHGWEFALGGLLALSSERLMASRWGQLQRIRSVATWIGLLAIAAAAVTFHGSAGFPGAIALLPVGGALLVIAAGTTTSRIQRPLLLQSWPVQTIGGASYSIYLWHWPIIVALPFVLGHTLGLKAKIFILIASLLLGWATKLFIEDPARRSRLLNRRAWVNYAVVVVAASAVAISSVVVSNVAGTVQLADQKLSEKAVHNALAGNNECFGAAAMTSPTPCADLHTVNAKFGPDFAADDWGSVAGVTKDGTLPDKSACVDFSSNNSGFLDCTLGNADAPRTLAIVGDSHALALFEPLLNLAESRGWKVRGFLRNSCSASLPLDYVSPGGEVGCNQWRTAVAKRIADDPTISLVITTGFTRGQLNPTAVKGTRTDLEHDYSDLWSEWTKAGKKVVAIEDVPLTSGQSVPDCVAASKGVPDPCTQPRSTALAFDPVVGAAAMGNPGVRLIDLTSAFCDSTTCHSVIGGLIAYRDSHHLSATFALTLTSRLSAAIPKD
jgi:peptidoglycan/LPS O-acetylase OafA/YrhL